MSASETAASCRPARPASPFLDKVTGSLRRASRANFLGFITSVSLAKCTVLFILLTLVTPPSQRLGYYPDSLMYETIADNVIAGHGFSLSTEAPYQPTMQKEPFYGTILAGVKALGGGIGTLIILQVLLNPLIAGLIFFLGLEVADELVARLSALLVAILPIYGEISLVVLPENMFLVVFVLAVLCMVKACRSGSRAMFLAAGLLLGLSALCKNVVLPLCVMYPLAVLVWRKGRWDRRLAVSLAVFLLAFATVTVPWMVRNQQKLGLFGISVRGGAFLSHQAAWAANFSPDEWKAYSLYLLSGTLAQKLYPQVIGTDLGAYEYDVLMRNPYVHRLLAVHREGEVEQLLVREAVQNITQHPFKYALLSAIVSLQSFKFLEPTSLTIIKGSAGVEKVLVFVRLALIVAGIVYTLAAFYGMVVARRNRPMAFLSVTVLYVLVASSTLGLIPGMQRYILPVTLFYSFFVSAALLGAEHVNEPAPPQQAGPEAAL